MATFGDERFEREVAACLRPEQRHFCSCTDTACPLNPNNPKNRERGRGCDACIKKCLALGEIPSCFFNEVGAWPKDWDDFTYGGFARHCREHGIGAAEQERPT